MSSILILFIRLSLIACIHITSASLVSNEKRAATAMKITNIACIVAASFVLLRFFTATLLPEIAQLL